MTKKRAHQPTSDAEAADFYEGRRDDDAWADEGDRRPAGPLDAIVSVRLTADEAALIRRIAGQRGVTLSAFIRAAALADAGRPMPALDTDELASTLESIVRKIRAAG